MPTSLKITRQAISEVKANMVRKQICSDCGDNRFFVNREQGEVICKNCSAVVEEALVDFGRERTFDSESATSVSRTGSPFDPRVANNLMTSVGNAQDLSGLSKEKRQMYKRISKKNNWTGSSLEQNFSQALSDLRYLASHHRLTESVEKEAARVYRNCAERGLTRKRSNESILLASLYIACRVNFIPKTMKEFAEASNVDVKTLGRVYKLISRTLSIKLTPANPIDYLGRFASELELSPKTHSKAIQIIEKATSSGAIVGLSPLSVAASSLYIAAILNKEKKTQKAVSEVSGITETTLRKRSRKLAEDLKISYKIR